MRPVLQAADRADGERLVRGARLEEGGHVARKVLQQLGERLRLQRTVQHLVRDVGEDLDGERRLLGKIFFGLEKTESTTRTKRLARQHTHS